MKPSPLLLAVGLLTTLIPVSAADEPADESVIVTEVCVSARLECVGCLYKHDLGGIYWSRGDEYYATTWYACNGGCDGGVRYVGDALNDEAYRVFASPGCTMVWWVDRDYQGSWDSCVNPTTEIRQCDVHPQYALSSMRFSESPVPDQVWSRL